MKRYFFTVCFLILTHFITSAQPLGGEAWCERVAVRMRDSLTLIPAQKDSIYAVNLRLMDLSKAAMAAGGTPENLEQALQLIEDTRDPLYLPILGNDKYLIYKTKKVNLVFSN